MSAWQPIETAPKGGAPVWLYDPRLDDDDFIPGGIVDGYWQDDAGWIGAVWDGSHDCWNALVIQPTHWMPRPAPPDVTPPRVEPSEDVVKRVAKWLHREDEGEDGETWGVPAQHDVERENYRRTARRLLLECGLSPVASDGEPVAYLTDKGFERLKVGGAATAYPQEGVNYHVPVYLHPAPVSAREEQSERQRLRDEAVELLDRVETPGGSDSFDGSIAGGPPTEVDLFMPGPLYFEWAAAVRRNRHARSLLISRSPSTPAPTDGGTES